ncbi:MAG: ArsA-related P-loop ATPase [Kofleriaceae bacterium]
MLTQKRIVVCVGPGGVGKTTTAAALALAAARRGLRTLVLTIDPAKRLANSLGLRELGHDPQRVDPALVHAGTSDRRGDLHAMMLDQKRAFDEIVAHHAKDPAAIQRILQNRVYQQISSTLAGAQEYAAMVKLHDFDRTGDWELIVVDTPPTSHALDFLDAPAKLSEAIDSPAIEWFRKIRGDSGSGWSLVGRTGSFVLKRLSKFVGSRFLDDLAAFFTEFHDILGGFRSRAEETFALLREPKVGFVLVASPDPLAIQEALYFHERLTTANMPFSAFVANRVHPSSGVAVELPQLLAELSARPSVAALGLSGTTLRIVAESLLASHRNEELLAAGDQRSLDALRAALDRQGQLIEVPLLPEDVHDVDRLITLGQYLTPLG